MAPVPEDSIWQPREILRPKIQLKNHGVAFVCVNHVANTYSSPSECELGRVCTFAKNEQVRFASFFRYTISSSGQPWSPLLLAKHTGLQIVSHKQTVKHRQTHSAALKPDGRIPRDSYETPEQPLHVTHFMNPGRARVGPKWPYTQVYRCHVSRGVK